MIDDRLVRGLDYYTGTVFEWVTDQLGAQDAVCAGGRYDGLVASRGGRPTPAVGFAMGLERLVELMSVQDVRVDDGGLDVYVIAMTDQQTAVEIGETLRDTGFRVCEHCAGGKLSSRMRRADRSGARFAIVVAEEEAADGSVQLKDLRGGLGQIRVPRDSLVRTLREIG